MTKENMKQLGAFVATALLTAGILYLAVIYRKANKASVSTDFLMDTFVEQKLYGENSKEAVQEISKRLRDYEQRFSMHLEDSEISKLNASAGKGAVELDEDVYDLLKRSCNLSLFSEGAFDITIAPLTKVWGITEENPSVPTEQNIAEAIALVNVNDLILYEDGTAELKREGQAVDLGAIAKGAACDIVKEVAAEYNIQRGYVSIGGNLVVLDKKPLGTDLWFGIRDPAEENNSALCTVQLYGKTMATTGGYERYFEEDGVRYHHVIDPQTGWPADSDLLSVSVICEDGTLADYLSTTLFVLGKETVLNCLDREDFQLVAVGQDQKVYCSQSLKGKLRMSDNTAVYDFVYGNQEITMDKGE